MARYIHGAIGPISGNLGTLTGASWRGVTYVRDRIRSRTTKSNKERLSQSKFAMAHAWLQPILDFVREGFRDDKAVSTGFNAAKSYLLKNAFEGVAPNVFINPALVKVSAGTLPLPANITAEKSGDVHIKFTWDAKYDEHSYDQVMMLAYDIENKVDFSRQFGDRRYTGTDTLEVVAGAKYHLYLAFNAADRSRRSDSVYLGVMEM